jgi:hypothetical protein
MVFNLSDEFRPAQNRHICGAGSALMADNTWVPLIVALNANGNVNLLFLKDEIASAVVIQCSYFKSFIVN